MTSENKAPSADLLRQSKANLDQNPFFAELRKRLQAQFDTTLLTVLSNADASEAALRANVGVLSGLHTALKLPEILIQEAEVQEHIERATQDNDDTEPE